MKDFMAALEEQRWDDHRFYHHNRINQSLHLFSSLCFVAVYVLLFVHPVAAALLGWPIAMLARQTGHFFFEPKGFDKVNQVTHEHKEDAKVGYNLKRKIVLSSLWALVPLLLVADSTVFGLYANEMSGYALLERICKLWIALGIGAVAFRTVHLFFLKDVQTGLVWATKIVTDPFHDIKLYHRAPLQALRGEMYDPRGPQRHGHGVAMERG
jgi:hypothetical protein